MEAKKKVTSHQSLYKCSTPPWKETYRKRCIDRLKKNRDKFIHRFRGMNAGNIEEDQSSDLKSLMSEEWDLMQREHHMMGQEQIGDLDGVLHIFEEIRRELEEEEQNILREYDERRMFDEESFVASINSHMSEVVTCPVCQRNRLLLNKGVIFCFCGVRVDTEQDCLNLSHVRQNLEEGISLHSSQCGHQPTFSVMNQLGIDNMLLTCQNCDFMHVVI